MKYFLITTNWQSVADAALQPFKFHDGLTEEQDKYPNLATSHTEQAFDLHLCCDTKRSKGNKWRTWDVLFCSSGFLLIHNAIADPATLRRIRLYSSNDSLKLFSWNLVLENCSNTCLVTWTFIQIGTFRAFLARMSNVIVYFSGPKRLSDKTNFVPHANFLRCYDFKTTKLKNASRLFHECVLSRQQHFLWMSAEFSCCW